uniref:Uncharacterized protein n=1 Tax=Oryza meridionalis TaxID=40149 RepID=A0A0E0D698_9ORYZ
MALTMLARPRTARTRRRAGVSKGEDGARREATDADWWLRAMRAQKDGEQAGALDRMGGS